jgi:hypothetical protein
MTLIFRNPHRRDAMILARLAGAEKCCLAKHQAGQRQQFGEQQAEHGERADAHRLSRRVIGCEVRAAISLLARIAQAEDDRLHRRRRGRPQ